IHVGGGIELLLEQRQASSNARPTRLRKDGLQGVPEDLDQDVVATGLFAKVTEGAGGVAQPEDGLQRVKRYAARRRPSRSRCWQLRRATSTRQRHRRCSLAPIRSCWTRIRRRRTTSI